MTPCEKGAALRPRLVPGHYVIEGDLVPELLATVTAWCASNGVTTEDLRIERRTLEDVFLELTGRELRP